MIVKRVLGRTRDGGSCAGCDADYRGRPYDDRGVRVLARHSTRNVTEPVNLCSLECDAINGVIDR